MKIVSCDRRRIKRERNRKENVIIWDGYNNFPVMIGNDFVRNSIGMFQMLRILYVNRSVADTIDTVYIENEKMTYKFPIGNIGNLSSKKKRWPFDVSHEITSGFMSFGKIAIKFNSFRDKAKFMLVV